MDTAVALVESYLRVNGYFTVTEFQVQESVLGQPGRYETVTDLDILAVRLPWAAETVQDRPRRPGERRSEILLAEDPALAPVAGVPDVLIGEVKEGAAELNPGLLKADVLYAALRRVGCCPEEHIGDAVNSLLGHGQFDVPAGGGIACRVRLASFAGHVLTPPPPAALVVTLDHVVRFLEDHLGRYREVLRSADFKDPLLGLLKLLDKLKLRLAP